MATGIGEAYLNIVPPKDNLSQSAQNLTQIFARQAEQKAERDEREKVRKERELKEWQDRTQLNFEDFNQKITGFNTFDDVGRDFTQQAVDKYVEYQRLAEDALKKGDFETKRLYDNKMLKLKGASAQVKDMVSKFATIHEEYQKMVDKGEMSGVDFDTWEAENYAIQAKNFALGFDENDNPIVEGVKTLNDGTAEPFSIPYSKMMDGSWRPYRRVDLLGNQGIVTSVLNSLGSYESQTDKGLKTIKTKLWTDELDKGTRDRLLPLVQSDEVMADLTNQFDRSSKKRTGFTDKDKENMVNVLTEMVRTGYKEKYTEEFNKDLAAHQRGLSQLQETQRHNRRTEQISQQNANTSERNSRAYAAKMMASAKKDRQDNFTLQTSDTFQAKLPNGVVKEFNTYTLGDREKGQTQPFIINEQIAKDGITPQLITASSVDVSTDGQIMRFRDNNGKQHAIARNGNFANIFRKIENQMAGREETREPVLPESPPPAETIESLKSKYNISY